MAHTCPACDARFTASEALCDNWKDPSKSLGCPHCGTFLIRVAKGSINPGIAGGLAAGGIWVPAFLIVLRAAQVDDVLFSIYGGIICLSMMVLTVLMILSGRQQLVPSSYRREEEPV